MLGTVKILPKRFAGFASGVFSGIEVMLHEDVEMQHLLLNSSTSQLLKIKKPGGKVNSPPGLNFGVVTSKDFRSRELGEVLNAFFFSSLYVLLLSFFSLPSTSIPPFQSAFAEICEEWNDFTTA